MYYLYETSKLHKPSIDGKQYLSGIATIGSAETRIELIDLMVLYAQSNDLLTHPHLESITWKSPFKLDIRFDTYTSHFWIVSDHEL
jgi:hypothetical protein